MPSHVDLLYIISCNERNSSNHPIPAFRLAPIASIASALPSPDKRLRAHLNGKVAVFDLEAFMEDDTDDVAFVVIRTVECSEASVTMASAGGPLRWTEDIYMKSKVSKYAMQQIAKCQFQPSPGDKPNSYPLQASTTTAVHTTIPFIQTRIDPADLFFFHHRQLLRMYALEYPESKPHIDDLLDYVDNRYGVEFAEAERSFELGLVTQPTF